MGLRQVQYLAADIEQALNKNNRELAVQLVDQIMAIAPTGWDAVITHVKNLAAAQPVSA